MPSDRLLISLMLLCSFKRKIHSPFQSTLLHMRSRTIHSSPNLEPLSHDIYGLRAPQSSNAKIVFLHGVLGSKRNWRIPCMKWVDENKTHECIAVDHRGHGSSTQPHFTDSSISPNTVKQCALDLNTLLTEHIHASPEILIGHSFGGKVALEYLKHRIENNLPIPKHTWILDSLPGTYNTSEPGGQSVTNVFKALLDMPRVFPSKEWMVKELVDRGVDRPVALWLAMNIVSVNINDQTELRWGFNLDTIVQLFDDFCNRDMWPFLEAYNGTGTIHFLRAGKNLAWTNSVLEKFHALSTANSRIKLHTMPHVGHWVHSEDLEGLFKILYRESLLKP